MPRLFPTLLLFLPILGCKKDEKSPPDAPTTSTGTTTTGVVTTDTTPPDVVGVVPVDGTEDVDPSAVIIVTFSEPLDPATVGENALQVSAVAQPVAGTVSQDGLELRFTASGGLPENATIEVSIDPTLADPAGNLLGDVDPTTFRTLWNPSPFVLLATYDPYDYRTQILRIDTVGPTPVAVPLTGGTAPDLWDAGDTEISIAPDGRRVLLSAHPVSGGEPGMLLCSVGGGGFRWLTSGTHGVGAHAWSPDATRLAFVDPSVRRDERMRLVGVGANAGMDLDLGLAPRRGWVGWSPSGDQVAWVDRDAHLWAAQADGSGPVDLSGAPVRYSRTPRWAPDGSAILYQEDPFESCNVERYDCVLTQDSSVCDPIFEACLDAARLFSVAPAGGAPVAVSPADVVVEQFAWIDATRFLWQGCDQCVDPDLYLSAVSGGAATPLLAADMTQSDWKLSPDGTQLAYQLLVGNSAVHVFDVDPGPSSERQVSPAGWEAWELAWSPDSSALAFVARPAPGGTGYDPLQAFVAPADGSGAVQLTSFTSVNDAEASIATFAADGEHVIYAAYDSAYYPDLRVYFASTDGLTTTHLDVGAGWVSTLQSWAPSGPGAVLDL